MFSIIADDREPAAAVLPWLAARTDVQLTVARLPVGNDLIDEALLFERKTLADLVGSIKDGRLFAQGLRLARAKARGAIVLEGHTSDLAAVPRIGKTTAKAIRWAVGESAAGYGEVKGWDWPVCPRHPARGRAVPVADARQGRPHRSVRERSSFCELRPVLHLRESWERHKKGARRRLSLLA